MNKPNDTQALSHIRVLDLSRILAGPWATQLLGDLGAQIIKVEKPATGDDTRHWGPPFLKDAQGQDSDTAAYYLSANRNKQSVAIDISDPQGQALIRALIADCDVLVENFKVDGLKQYGLDYDSVHALNPRLVYCSITGFGQTGPYAQRAGYDFLIQGLGGLMSLTGQPDGQAGAGPMKVGVALTDVMTGLYASNAILAALAYRDKSGEGQHIDVSLLDVQIATLANQALNYATTGISPRRLGNAHPSIVPYEDFPTSDGYMILAIGNDAQFARFCEEAGQAQLATDARFATNAQRVQHRVELIAQLRRITVTRSTAEWVQTLESKAVPCGPINQLADVFADPHVQARGNLMQMRHSALGELPQIANPMHLSASPVRYTLAPPTLGEHTAEVLQSLLALDDTQLSALRHAGVIA